MKGWIAFNMAATVALFTTTLAVLVRQARRERRLTTPLALYLATLTLGWMEAVIDWGAFVYYAPSWPHFPTDWPVLRLIPIVPLHIPLCYTWFFFGGAWLAVRAAKAIAARQRRPRMGFLLLLSGFVSGFVLDVVVENFFIVVAGAWTYTQTWEPLTLRAGTDTQWPVYMAFAMGLSIAPMAYFLGHRNDRGEDVLQVMAARLAPRRRGRAPAVASGIVATRPPRTAQHGPARRAHWAVVLGLWVVFVHGVYGTVSLGYAALRWTGVQESVSTVQPYPDGKPWFDGDVTRPEDPTVNREPIRKAVEAGIQPD